VKRLRKILFNTATAISLLLFIAVSILWVRSYNLSDQFIWKSKTGWRSLSSGTGHLIVNLLVTDWSERPGLPLGLEYRRDQAIVPFNYLMDLNTDATDIDTTWEWRGFAWYSKRTSRDLIAMGVAPFWSIAMLAGALPVAWTMFRWRSGMRNRRKRGGCCVTCGYDLRATPDRCPECGTAVALAVSS